MKATGTAIKSYISTDDSSFSFKEGDAVLITDTDDKGWAYGALNGKKGWFPANYVQIHQKEEISELSNKVKENFTFSTSLKNLLGSSLPQNWKLSSATGTNVSFINVITKETASSLSEVYEKNSRPNTPPVNNNHNQMSDQKIQDLSQEWDKEIYTIKKAIKALDSMIKEQDFKRSISQTCHITKHIYGRFTLDTPTGVSSTTMSGMSRVLLKLGKLIAASVILNSYWSLSDSIDNARYQAGQVAAAWESFASLQVKLNIFPEFSKISRNEFNNLLIQNITTELKNGAEFLQIEAINAFSSLKKSLHDELITNYDVHTSIGVFFHKLGVLISYTEVIECISGNKRISSSLQFTEKRQACIDIIKTGFIGDKDKVEFQKKIIIDPGFEEKLKIAIKDLMLVVENVLRLQSMDPLKLNECIFPIEPKSPSHFLRDSHLSYLALSKNSNLDLGSGNGSQILSDGRKRDADEKDLSTLQSFNEAIEKIIIGSESEAMKGFLLCFRLYGTPNELLLAVNKCVDDRHHDQSIIINAALFLSTWIESFWDRQKDYDCINDIYNFFKIKLKDKMDPKMINSVLLMISKKMHNTEKVDSPLTNHNLPKPILPKTKSWTLFEVDKREMARQICLFEMELFSKIKPGELLKQEWASKNKRNIAINVRNLVSFSTKMSEWIIRSILEEADIRQRVDVLRFFIRICTSLMSLSNFNAVFAINSALNSSPIDRLKKTWDMLPDKYHTSLEVIRQAIDHSKNFYAYRQTLKRSKIPCIPFLGLFLTDFTFLDDGNPDYIKGQINMDKCDRYLKLVENFQSYQSKVYEFQPVTEIRERLLEAINRETKHDQDSLYELSLSIEPRETDTSSTQLQKTMNALQKSGIL